MTDHINPQQLDALWQAKLPRLALPDQPFLTLHAEVKDTRGSILGRALQGLDVQVRRVSVLASTPFVEHRAAWISSVGGGASASTLPRVQEGGIEIIEARVGNSLDVAATLVGVALNAFEGDPLRYLSYLASILSASLNLRAFIHRPHQPPQDVTTVLESAAIQTLLQQLSAPQLRPGERVDLHIGSGVVKLSRSRR